MTSGLELRSTGSLGRSSSFELLTDQSLVASQSEVFMRLLNGSINPDAEASRASSVAVFILKISLATASGIAKIPFGDEAAKLANAEDLKYTLRVGESLAGVALYGRSWWILVSDTIGEHRLQKVAPQIRKTSLTKTALKTIGIYMLGMGCRGAEFFIALKERGLLFGILSAGLFAGPTIQAMGVMMERFQRKAEGSYGLQNLLLKAKIGMLNNPSTLDEILTLMENHADDPTLFMKELLRIALKNKKNLIDRQSSIVRKGRHVAKIAGMILPLATSVFRGFAIYHFSQDSIKQKALIGLIILLTEGPESIISSIESRKTFSRVYKMLFSLCSFVPHKYTPGALTPYANTFSIFLALGLSAGGIGWLIEAFFSTFNIKDFKEIQTPLLVWLVFIILKEGSLLTASYGHFSDASLDFCTNHFGKENSKTLLALSKRFDLAVRYCGHLSKQEFGNFIEEVTNSPESKNRLEKALKNMNLLDLEEELESLAAI